MLRTLYFFRFFLLLVVGSAISYAQMPLANTAKVSILTCEKGNELYSLFGHTAIRIKDEPNALDVVYNYGAFDFRTENFYLKFIKGDLRYFVSAYAYNEFYYEYTIENRAIYEQELQLSNIQKQQLFDALNHSLMSDEKYYTYKFIDRNCTNMVVDKVNQTLNTNCIVKTTEKGQTYREILFPYLENHFYENLGINIIFGKKVDEPGNKLFLPNQFMESLKTAQCNGKKIASSPITLLKAAPTATEKSYWNSFFSFCIILVVLVATRKKWIYLTVFSVFGLLGLFLSVVGLYSFHEEVSANYNVLLFNPLLLVLIFMYWRKNWVWVNRIALLLIISITIETVVLVNKPNLIMFSPIIVSLILMLLPFLPKKLLPSVK